MTQENDGQPSVDALADGADDGVAFISQLFGNSTAGGQGSVQVTAALGGNTGLLNAWIDFNRDGDWNDSGERIFDDVTLAEGANVLTFSIPSNALFGETAARFRLSNTEDLVETPTGFGGRGEVEDYVVTLLDAADSAAEVSIGLPESVTDVELVLINGLTTVRRSGSGQILLQIDRDASSPVTINGNDVDNRLLVDFSNGNPIPSGGINFQGAGQSTDNGDAIVINGNSSGIFDRVEYIASDVDDDENSRDGTIAFSRSNTNVGTIHYTGLEPIIDNTNAADRVFTIDSASFPGDHSIRIADDAMNGYSLIESNGGPQFESISFVNPTNSLTVNSGDGANSLTLETLDASFSASVTLNGGAGRDSFDVTPSANYTIEVNGDSPTGSIGDSLRYRGTGSVNLTDSANKVGTVTASNLQDVTFTNLEDLQTDDARELSIADIQQSEGQDGTRLFTFVVSISNPHIQDVLFLARTADGTASVANQDYIGFTSQIVTIPAGQSQARVQVEVLGDFDFESDETFELVLSNIFTSTVEFDTRATVRSATATIRNDDEVFLSISDLVAVEGDDINPFYLTASLTHPIDQPVTFDFRVDPGTAIANVDYETVSGTVVIPAGESQITFPITVIGDEISEPDKDFTVTITSFNSGGRVFAGDFQANVTILDDDLLSVVGVKVGSTRWAPEFRSFIDSTGSDFGYLIPTGDDQVAPLPWANINQIQLQFNSDIEDSFSPLLFGINGFHANYNFDATYDPSNFTVTLTLDSFIGDDQLIVAASELLSSGTQLDGEWTTGQTSRISGDRTAGGNFAFEFRVLPGDVNQSGKIRSNDGFASLIRQFNDIGDELYMAFADFNGNGKIQSNDGFFALSRQYTEKAVGTPTVPQLPQSAAAIAAAIEGIFEDDEVDRFEEAIMNDDLAGESIDDIIDDVANEVYSKRYDGKR